MANLTIRNLDDEIANALKKQAKAHNRSLEAELRQILTDHVRGPSQGAQLRAIAEHIAAMTPDVPQTDSAQMIRDDRDLRNIVQEIGSGIKSVIKASFPSQPAVYGIFANEPDCLSAIQFKGSDFLYLGKSISLISRGHFETGKTASSTLRRTLGSLPSQELGLRAYARGRGRGSRDFANYRFDEIGEKKLTEWMGANLQIGFSIVVNDIDETEKRLIRYCEPVLNLNLWPNPQAKEIRTLRKICADEARINGPLRNHRI